MNVLVTGATGYIGGRLIPRLLKRGHLVRVLVRDASRIEGRPWAGSIEVVVGDLLDSGGIGAALDGVDAAYYLVHSMYAGATFVERDRMAAACFGEAAARAECSHLIYLGGLQQPSGTHSKHLASRDEVGRILSTYAPTTELRAGPIIGSGSASFEMIRYLTERLPVMIVPRTILNRVQPIAVRNILEYLEAILEGPPRGVVEVGGEALTFLDMMTIYARVRGLSRAILPVSWIAPRMTAGLVTLVTPIPYNLALPLIEGLSQELIVHNNAAAEIFPKISVLSYQTAVELALQRISEENVATRWSGALAAAGTPVTRDVVDREGMISEIRSVHIEAPPEEVYRVFSGLGGNRGWLVWNWVWWIRGAIDRLLEGPGLRRGRRHPRELLAGEAVDFWRVESVTPGRSLRLRAEMRVPGRAWFEFEVVSESGGSRLVQTASFEPHGLAGWLYWYLLYPIHRVVFSALANAIGAEAAKGREGTV